MNSLPFVSQGIGAASRRRQVCRVLPGVVAWLALASGLTAAAQSLTSPPVTQVIQLHKGWNSVHLKVDPADSDPAKVFAGLPVTTVATYFPGRTPVEFIQDPGSAAWKQRGWNVWYAPSLPESAISDLAGIPGGQGYLIHASGDATWTIAGTVRKSQIRWKSDSYNLVGFPVDPVAPPTFAAWFADSPAHQSTTRPGVFELDGSGHWRPVERKDSTLIQPDAAYWVFCNGGSDYQGPLELVMPPGGQGSRIDFGNITETLTLRFRNRTTAPVRFTLELGAGSTLPLSLERKVLEAGTRSLVAVEGTTGFGPVAANDELVFRIALDRSLMAQREGAALLTLRDDIGTYLRIPVVGRLP